MEDSEYLSQSAQGFTKPRSDTVSTGVDDLIQGFPIKGEVLSPTERPKALERALFHGNTKIACKGKIITSANNAWVSVTLLIIAILVILFSIFIARDIYRNLGVWPLLFTYILIIVVFVSCALTSWRDPGILPRGLHPRSTLRMIGATDYGVDGTMSRLVFHDQNLDFLFGKEIIINNERTFLKYCGTCEIFRPPRCSHCNFCDNCVEEFDHHCPWVSNCIGKRNYRFFLLFIISLSSLCILISAEIGVLFYRLKETKNLTFGDSLLDYWCLVAFFVITSLSGQVLSILSLYHCFLVSNSMTTSEQVKQARAGGTGIFDEAQRRSCWRNFWRIFCTPIPLSTVNWSHYSSAKALPSKECMDYV